MNSNLRGVIIRLIIFTLVCSTGIFVIFAIFAQFRFDAQQTYSAVFSNVAGLKNNQFVRIAGVEVGKIKKISINDDAMAVVEFTADDSVVLTEGTRAAIRYADLVGGRYLSLEEGAGGTKRLEPGQTIPLDRTEPALDLDALIGGFRPLFRALNPDQVNALSGQLIEAFQGEGATVGSFLDQAAALTNTLADRDDLIKQVIDNLNVVLGSLGDKSKQLDKTVDSLSQLVKGLADRKTAIASAVANANTASIAVGDLLQQARPPLQDVVKQTDRVGAIAVADHAYLENLLNTLPDKYRILNRLGIYGDYFTFYLCDAILRVNGKGGQPVYIKLVGQDTGRCAPK